MSINLEPKRTSVRRPPARPTIRHKIEQRLSAEILYRLAMDHQTGDTTPVLAKRYGISTTAVKRLLHQRGVPLRRYHHLTEQEVAQAAQLYRAGWSLAKLGHKLEADDETIQQRLKEAGVVMRRQGGRWKD